MLHWVVIVLRGHGHMTLILLAIAWMLGIVAADLLHLALPPLLVGALACGVAAALAGRAPHLRLAALMLCCAALGGVRLDLAHVTPTPRSVWLLNDSGDLRIEGVVVDDPKRTEDGQRALVAADRALVGGKTQLVEA